VVPDDTTQTKLKEFQILLEKLVEYSLAHPATFVALLQQYPNGKQTYAKDIMSQTLRFLLFLLVSSVKEPLSGIILPPNMNTRRIGFAYLHIFFVDFFEVTGTENGANGCCNWDFLSVSSYYLEI